VSLGVEVSPAVVSCGGLFLRSLSKVSASPTSGMLTKLSSQMNSIELLVKTLG